MINNPLGSSVERSMVRSLHSDEIDSSFKFQHSLKLIIYTRTSYLHFWKTEELLPVEKNHMRKELEKVLISKSAVSAMMAIVDDRRSFDLP